MYYIFLYFYLVIVFQILHIASINIIYIIILLFITRKLFNRIFFIHHDNSKKNDFVRVRERKRERERERERETSQKKREKEKVKVIQI